MRSILENCHVVEASSGLREPCRKERDPTVKLVVACCSSEFHITAIFDDLDRRFTHRPSPFLHRGGNVRRRRGRTVARETPKIAFSRKQERLRCSRCSQSGCNMLM